MYNRDLLDREIVREFLGGVTWAWWDIGSWFIERQRKRGETDLIQWKRMRDDMLSFGA